MSHFWKVCFNTLKLFTGKYSAQWIFAALAAVFLPYLYLSFFAWPAADDYCDAMTWKELGFLQAWIQRYYTWSGRYIASGFCYVNPLNWNSLYVYKGALLAIIVFSLYCLYFFVRSCSRGMLSVISALNVSLGFLLLHFFNMPSVAQGIYWYPSAVTYQLGICFTMICFGTMINYLEGNFFFNRTVHRVLTIFFLIVACGFNEGNTLFVLSLLIWPVVFLMKKQKIVPVEMWIWLGIGTLCTAASILAPGNFVREGYYANQHHLFRSCAFTLLQSFRFGLDWISNLPMLLGAILFSVYLYSKGKASPWLSRLLALPPWIFLLAAGWILFIFIFPSYWTSNIMGQHRTVNAACFYFTLAWFLFAASLVNRYGGVVRIPFFPTAKFKAAVLAVLLLTMAATRNGYTVFTDILYRRVNAFQAELHARQNLLEKETQGNEVILLKPLRSRPPSLFVLDASGDTADWVNQCQATYFRQRAIVCKE